MPLNVFLALLPAHFPELAQPDPQVIGPLSVVIDTLRFTTTACQALAVGALDIRVALDVETARDVAQQSSGCLLCGERLCRPIAGFDLGNSPSEYTRQSVAGRRLVFTTTNGTQAVERAQGSRHILLAGLVNRSSVAQWILLDCETAPESDVWIICSGTDGQVAGEDVLAAGAIVACLVKYEPKTRLGNDAAWLALDNWHRFEDAPSAEQTRQLVQAFHRFSGGGNLVENGYEQDLQFAAGVDSLKIVPCNSNTGRPDADARRFTVR